MKNEFTPGDMVLVRDGEGCTHDKWCVDIFSYIENGEFVCTGNANYKECLLFNEETKHLIGTSDSFGNASVYSFGDPVNVRFLNGERVLGIYIGTQIDGLLTIGLKDGNVKQFPLNCVSPV